MISFESTINFLKILCNGKLQMYQCWFECQCLDCISCATQNMTLVQNITKNRLRHTRGPVHYTLSPLHVLPCKEVWSSKLIKWMKCILYIKKCYTQYYLEYNNTLWILLTIIGSWKIYVDAHVFAPAADLKYSSKGGISG